MKEQQVEDEMYHIIAEKLTGELSPEKEPILQKWLEKSPENQKLFEELKHTWEITGVLQSNLNPDTDAEWQRFQSFRKSGTSPLEKELRQTFIQRIPSFVKVAAAIVLTFSIAFGAYKTFVDQWEYITMQTLNGNKEFRLADGSLIVLKKNSEFSYPKTFSGKSRKVKLEGEAYFSVAKDSKPFIITTQHTITKVLGTKFDLKAYPGREQTELSVTEGKVSFGGKKKNSKAIVTSGQYASYNAKTKVIRTRAISDSVKTSEYNLTFKNAPLAEIAENLSARYGVQIMTDDHCNNLYLTASFEDMSLKEALEIIELTLEVGSVTRNDTVFITGLRP
jgi:transmembrane sensor